MAAWTPDVVRTRANDFISPLSSATSADPEKLALLRQLAELQDARNADQRRCVLLSNRVEVEAALAGRPNSGVAHASALMLQRMVRARARAHERKLILQQQAESSAHATRLEQAATRLQAATRSLLVQRAHMHRRSAARQVQQAFREYKKALRSHTKTDLLRQLQHTRQRLEVTERELDGTRANINDEAWLKDRLLQLQEMCEEGGVHDWRDLFGHRYNERGVILSVCAKCQLTRDRHPVCSDPGPLRAGITFTYPNGEDLRKAKICERPHNQQGYEQTPDKTWGFLIRQRYRDKRGHPCEGELRSEHFAHLPPAGRFKMLNSNISNLVDRNSGKAISQCEWGGKTGREWGYHFQL